jgi:hypothetical protein
LWPGLTALPSQAFCQARPAVDCTAGLHSGEITTNQTWCAADNPHLVSGEVTVAAGATLTIKPGAIVQAVLDLGYTYSGMHILGRLEAIGTEEQPILFTSSTDSGPEQWRGLGFDGSAASGVLRYVTVRYGGACIILKLAVLPR